MTSWMHIEKEGVSHLGLVFWWRDGDEQCRWENKKNLSFLSFFTFSPSLFTIFYTQMLVGYRRGYPFYFYLSHKKSPNKSLHVSPLPLPSPLYQGNNSLHHQCFILSRWLFNCTHYKVTSQHLSTKLGYQKPRFILLSHPISCPPTSLHVKVTF